MELIKKVLVGKKILFIEDVGFDPPVHFKGKIAVIADVTIGFDDKLRFFTRESLNRSGYNGWLNLDEHFIIIDSVDLIQVFKNDIKILPDGK